MLNITLLILQDGKVEGELVPVDELLKRVTKTRFTLAELLEPTLPEGVDPLKLESYLSDEEFQVIGFKLSFIVILVIHRGSYMSAPGVLLN